MSQLKVIRLEPHGPVDTGMVELPKIDPALLSAGEPVARGHNYFTDETGTLISGVWDCTAMTTKLAPYAVNELMIVLEGSVTVIDQRGREETIKAGESFIIPKGMPCIWKQTGYVRKFYVIFDDPSGAEPKDPAALEVIRLSPHGPADTGMPELEKIPAEALAAGDPVPHGHNYFDDLTGQMSSGVWGTTPMTTKPGPFPRNELMYILEGAVRFTNEDGSTEEFKAGECLLVPKGAVISWHNDEYVRKFYCIFEP